MSAEIPYLPSAALTREILQGWLYPDLAHDLYWTDCWDPAFYRQLAHAGFISVAYTDARVGDLLLPELQTAYALLDWPDRRVSANVQRLLRSGHLAQTGAWLTVTPETRDVAAAIGAVYGEDCWLHARYRALLRDLAQHRVGPFRFVAVEVRSDTGHLIAGELGYTLGATYTSLTGFVDRTSRTWRHYGTLQLHALAVLLQQSGYAFWNLGHPQMPYKLALGARVVPRAAFLARWLPACAAHPTRTLDTVLGQRFACVALLNTPPVTVGTL